MMRFHNRLTGQTSRTLPTQPLLGQWQILTEAESVTINAISILPQSRKYIFPNATQRYSLRLPDGTLEEQIFPDWQIPSDLLLESIQFFEQRLRELTERDSLWESWVSTSPLIHDIRDTIRLQPLEELIKKDFGHLEEICRRFSLSPLKQQLEK